MSLCVDMCDVLASDLIRLSGTVTKNGYKAIIKDAFGKFTNDFNPEDFIYFSGDKEWKDEYSTYLKDTYESNSLDNFINMYLYFYERGMNETGYLMMNLFSYHNGMGIVSISHCHFNTCNCKFCLGYDNYSEDAIDNYAEDAIDCIKNGVISVVKMPAES